MNCQRQLFLCFVVIFFLGMKIAFAQEDELAILRPGDLAPKIVSPDIFGKTFNSDDLKGEKLLLISFFGTLCGPCIAEFPELKQLYAEYNGKLDVLMVNKGMEGREELKKFRKDHDILDFRMVRDRFDNIGEPYGVDAVPVTILVGLDGKILCAHYKTFKEGKLVETLSPIIRENMDE